jgi:DNA (cytosine-5)-methyltransferase 1
VNVLDLFSGIGGFSLGLERAGMRTVAFCERDEYCRAVLRKHWPDVPCIEDIHAIDAERLGGLPSIDLVCGGFPCQPFSVAGKQRAQADDRHLWPQMRRVIALARPTWVLAENVTGLIALALDDVLADLESIRYAARAVVIPAVAVDARHRRDRVWIIARDRDRDRESTCSFDAEMEELRGVVADSNCATGERFGQHSRKVLPDQTSVRFGSSGSTATNTNSDAIRNESERVGWSGGSSIAGNACRWLPEPNVGRVAHGVPRRVDRLRALGNAVVPQIPEIIGRAIMRQRA